MRIALTVAGSDPTGGAGLQLDLQVFRCLGVHGAGVVTALTVQDTDRVHQVLPAFPSVVSDQLRVLLRDLLPHAIKLGMLATEDVLRAVSLGLEAMGPAPQRPPLVIDPVLCASDGTRLLERRALRGLLELCGQATLVTPNLPEVGALTGRDVSDRRGTEAAARTLVEEVGARAALVKGGHAQGPPSDCLALRGREGTQLRWLEGSRIPAGAVHGTGCALSAAITASLASGAELEQAVTRGRLFVRGALERSQRIGKGAALLGLA